MKKFGLIILGSCLVLLSGCATQKEMIALGGSKADGTVKMGYKYFPHEAPVINERQAADLAGKKCSVWGYKGAEAFGGETVACIQPGSFGGCNLFQASVEYQCIGGEASNY